MRIAYNPTTAAALTAAPSNNDITFDLKGIAIYAKGVKFKGTDTTYSIFKKHTSDNKGGCNGLVPVPSYTTTAVRFLREDGTWVTPTDTTGYGLINQGTSNTTCTLNPNTFYVWETVSALSLSFGSAISGITNEYTFQFTSSSSGTSLTLPSTVKWARDEVIEIEANKTYQVSIVNNLATYLMWS